MTGPLFSSTDRIDRVDLAATHAKARVVDYKTGKRPARDEQGKSAFQLPLYAAVVARELGVEDVEAVYVSVTPRGLVEAWPKGEKDRLALSAQRREAMGAARLVVLSLWQGNAPPRPTKAATCTHCDARDVCRRPAIAPVEDA